MKEKVDQGEENRDGFDQNTCYDVSMKFSNNEILIKQTRTHNISYRMQNKIKILNSVLGWREGPVVKRTYCCAEDQSSAPSRPCQAALKHL